MTNTGYTSIAALIADFAERLGLDAPAVAKALRTLDYGPYDTIHGATRTELLRNVWDRATHEPWPYSPLDDETE